MNSTNTAGSAQRPPGFFSRIKMGILQHSINQVGKRTVFAGAPHVDNDGFIQIGADCLLSSHPIQSHLVVMPRAKLIIGDHVSISYGAAISARCGVQIGDNTRIGPFCLILDNDFHSVGDRDAPGGVAAIEIGRNVVLGARVTVLRGARIGDGASVMSGSTVAGVIANDSIVAGVPARVGGNDSTRMVGRSVATIVMRIFRLRSHPTPLDGPAQIPEWNDMGSVRVLLALEEAFGVTLCEEQVRAARSIAELGRLVILASGRSSQVTGR